MYAQSAISGNLASFKFCYPRTTNFLAGECGEQVCRLTDASIYLHTQGLDVLHTALMHAPKQKSFYAYVSATDALYSESN